MHLVIFDIDGTLTGSTAVDADCYFRAVSDELGRPFDTDWTTYRHVTDAGVLVELLDRHGLDTSPARLASVRQRFIELLADAFDANPGCCRQVPGAAAIIEHLREADGVQIAIATGAWADSARLKLRHAELAVTDLPFASSDDAHTREDILRVAVRRAAAAGGLERFERVTCVGDGPWDVAAARALGFDFIGIACDGRPERLASAGAPVVFADYADRPAFTRRLLAG